MVKIVKNFLHYAEYLLLSSISNAKKDAFIYKKIRWKMSEKRGLAERNGNKGALYFIWVLPTGTKGNLYLPLQRESCESYRQSQTYNYMNLLYIMK